MKELENLLSKPKWDKWKYKLTTKTRNINQNELGCWPPTN
jgi:hypothetical protein